MVAVLEYSTTTVHFLKEPDGLENTEDIEDWLNEKGFRLADCEYMYGDEMSIAGDYNITIL